MRNSQWIVVAFVLVQFYGCLAQQGTGIQFFGTQALLDEINALIPKTLEPIIEAIKIPDLTGQFEIPLLGTYTYWLSSITLVDLNLTGSATVITSDGFTSVIVGGVLTMTADYKWESDGIIKYSDHGSVLLQIDGTNTEVALAVAEANGRPTIACVGSPAFSIGQIKMTFYGKVSWIYNDLLSLFSGLIDDFVNNKAPGLIAGVIDNQIETALQQLQVDVPWKGVLMDFAMTSPPEYMAQLYFGFGVSGEWQIRVDPQPCPYTAAPLPITPVNAAMFQFYVGDYVVDCTALTYYEMGMIHFVIDQQSLPPEYAKYLNTSVFELILPDLYKKYPDMALSIEIIATKPPLSQTSAQGVNITVVNQVNVSVVDTTYGEPELVPVFSVKAENGVLFTLYINDSLNRVHPSLEALECSISLLSSEIGYVPINILNAVLQLVCKDVVSLLVNNALPKGIQIPVVKGFELQDPQVLLGEGYFGVSSSVVYIG